MMTAGSLARILRLRIRARVEGYVCPKCGKSGGSCYPDERGVAHFCRNKKSGAPRSNGLGGYDYRHSDEPKLSLEKQHEKDAQALERALELWRSSVPIDGTPAEKYLRERAIARARTGWPMMLRFAERCWYPYAPKQFPPAMVAAVGRWNGKAIDLIGVQRTYLQFSGVWLDRNHYDKRERWIHDDRLNLGKVGQGGVWFMREPSSTLYVGEGVETVLAAMQIHKAVAGCAATSTSGLRTLVLPPFVKHVVIAADNDRSGEGMKAARDAERRWLAHGIDVRITNPKRTGFDFNDVLQERKRRRR